MMVKDLDWKEEQRCGGEDTIFFARVEQGRFSVLNRLTGYGEGFYRDTETGFKDIAGKFWLASGMMDIRQFPDLTIEEAIDLVKKESNTCVGV